MAELIELKAGESLDIYDPVNLDFYYVITGKIALHWETIKIFDPNSKAHLEHIEKSPLTERADIKLKENIYRPFFQT